MSLLVARVKKIIHADDEISACSNNAAFAVAVATEMFIQHMVEQAHNVVKSERRPRRNIQYKDIGEHRLGVRVNVVTNVLPAHAVARIDNLEFLTDVVPQTTTYRAYAEKKAKPSSKSGQVLGNGQRTMEQMSARPEHDSRVEDMSSILLSEEEVARADAQHNNDMPNGFTRSPHGNGPTSNGSVTMYE